VLTQVDISDHLQPKAQFRGFESTDHVQPPHTALRVTDGDCVPLSNFKPSSFLTKSSWEKLF